MTVVKELEGLSNVTTTELDTGVVRGTSVTVVEELEGLSNVTTTELDQEL